MIKMTLALLITLAANAVFAAPAYTCRASFDHGNAVQTGPLELIAENIQRVVMSPLQFTVTQVSEDTLVLSIFNRAKRSEASTATTFVPKSGKPSNLLLRLESGAASLTCTVNE